MAAVASQVGTPATETPLDWADRLVAPERAKARSRGYQESLLILKALRLCPTLELGEMYLRGEPVPLSMLNQRWARAYGLIK